MANTGRSHECFLDSIPIMRSTRDQTPKKKIAINTTICQDGTLPLHKYAQFRPYGALNQKFCTITVTKNHYLSVLSKTKTYQNEFSPSERLVERGNATGELAVVIWETNE
jgi:hypothetical protein